MAEPDADLAAVTPPPAPLPGVGGRLRGGEPSAILSDVHVMYRVYGVGRENPTEDAGQDEISPLTRLVRRSRPSTVGVRYVHAVKGVSFVAMRGQSIGLIGRNGSGKSTILRAMAGLMPLHSGRVWLDGEARLLGVNAVLKKNLSGTRNILIGLQAQGFSRARIRELYDGIVEFSGIGDFVDLPMSAYSSGMAARLRFAISTATVPDILIVDEALATGDADFRERATERIAQIREQAGTVFMVSHSDKSIRSQCDRALWMDGGRLLMDGDADDVVDAYAEWNTQQSQRSKARARRRARGAGSSGS